MNNSFHETNYDLEYIIPYSRQLSSGEATRIVARAIQQEKESLLEAWKSNPKHKDWKGDEERKKEELFIERHKSKAAILVSSHTSEEVLGDDPQTRR